MLFDFNVLPLISSNDFFAKHNLINVLNVKTDFDVYVLCIMFCFVKEILFYHIDRKSLTYNFVSRAKKR